MNFVVQLRLESISGGVKTLVLNYIYRIILHLGIELIQDQNYLMNCQIPKF